MLVVHTADVHIGVENYGIPDPSSKVSSRLTDFLKTLDEVITYSIDNKADIVLFCGDAYKSRNPNQTHQREFASRIARLSKDGIQVFLLSGNHDSPNIPGPATALEIFPTLSVTNVHIGDKLETHLIDTRSGPVQVVALPWIRKGQFLSNFDPRQKKPELINLAIEDHLTEAIRLEAESLDPNIPSILAGHVSLNTAKTSSEKSMMLGKDYVLLKSAIALPHFDYVALGHIHKHQILNENPRVVYPGSLQRIDFGEENDTKGFCSLELNSENHRGNREEKFRFIEVNARKFVTAKIQIKEDDNNPTATIIATLNRLDISESVVQVLIDVAPGKLAHIDDDAIKQTLSAAHLVSTIRKNVIEERRIRFSSNLTENASPSDILKAYLESRDITEEKTALLLERGSELISESPPPAYP